MMNRHQRLQALANRFNQLINRQTSQNEEDGDNPSTSGTLVDRLRVFRRDQEPRRRRAVAQRMITIRVAVLPNARDTVFIPRPGSSLKKIVVPLSMPESAFINRLRAEFPSLQGDFCLCRVDRRRRIHELELSSRCPSAIKACPELRRSAVYLKPKENEEDERDGEENPDLLEEQSVLEEEDQNRLEEDMLTDQVGEQGVERAENVLLEWRALRHQQDEEYESSLAEDRERERRRRVFQEREIRRIQVINSRKQILESMAEPENGIAVQCKYPDGGVKRRRFLSSQPFQDLVAFAGTEEMASEVFSLQEVMSPTSILSTRRGSLAENGITTPCTLYILWMSGDEVEDIVSNNAVAHGPTPAAPPITVPTLPPAPSPPFTVPTLPPAPSPPITAPTPSPAPSPPITVPTPSPAPSPPITVPTPSPAPSPPITVPTPSPAPSPPITVPTLSPAPSLNHSPTYLSSAPSSPDREVIEQPVDVAAALKALKSRVHRFSPAANQINVIRNEELDCALRAFRRPAFDPQSKLDVVFIDEDGRGEGAIDDGGPTREFCRLLMGQLQGCQIFEGPLEARKLALDSVALHNNTYRFVGQMLAVCLIQGGVSPHFFSKRLFSQVCGLPSSPATIEEVVDQDLRSKLEKISSAETLEDARQAVNETAEELALLGGLQHLRSLEHRTELMEAVLQFYCEGRIHAALEQFKEGLHSLGVLAEVMSHPQAFEAIFFQDTTPLKACDIEELFQARCRSLPGSNRRRMEARTVAFWKDWLLDIEGGTATPVTLEHVLIFATGLRRIPAMGFELQPQIEFLHPEDGLARFPKANTCALVLRLPVCLSYSEFKENMEFGLLSADQFGEA